MNRLGTNVHSLERSGKYAVGEVESWLRVCISLVHSETVGLVHGDEDGRRGCFELGSLGGWSVDLDRRHVKERCP